MFQKRLSDAATLVQARLDAVIADFGDVRILFETKEQAYLFATDLLGLGWDYTDVDKMIDEYH